MRDLDLSAVDMLNLKLNRASCIVAHVANAALQGGDQEVGETLFAAQELIEAARAIVREGAA